MEAFTEWNWTDRKLKNYKLEKFKFSIVGLNTVKFGEQGYFVNSVMKIDHFSKNQPWVSARDEYSKINILHGNFTYAGVWIEDGALIAATCDRF